MIKLDYKTTQETGSFVFALETNREEDLPIIDAFLFAIKGDFPMAAGYVSSNRLVVKYTGLPLSNEEEEVVEDNSIQLN